MFACSSRSTSTCVGCEPVGAMRGGGAQRSVRMLSATAQRIKPDGVQFVQQLHLHPCKQQVTEAQPHVHAKLPPADHDRPFITLRRRVSSSSTACTTSAGLPSCRSRISRLTACSCTHTAAAQQRPTAACAHSTAQQRRRQRSVHTQHQLSSAKRHWQHRQCSAADLNRHKISQLHHYTRAPCPAFPSHLAAGGKEADERRAAAQGQAAAAARRHAARADVSAAAAIGAGCRLRRCAASLRGGQHP